MLSIYSNKMALSKVNCKFLSMIIDIFPVSGIVRMKILV